MPGPETRGREGAVGLFFVAGGEADQAVEVVGETGSDDMLPEVGRDQRDDLINEEESEVPVSLALVDKKDVGASRKMNVPPP